MCSARQFALMTDHVVIAIAEGAAHRTTTAALPEALDQFHDRRAELTVTIGYGWVLVADMGVGHVDHAAALGSGITTAFAQRKQASPAAAKAVLQSQKRYFSTAVWVPR